MYEIIWCIFIVVSLNQLNGSAGYRYYLTSHPNMIRYSKILHRSKSPGLTYPLEDNLCGKLKESRIFKAADPDAPNFKPLGTDWDSLLNFTDPSLLIQNYSSIEQLNTDLKNEIDKLENNKDLNYNAQLLCFQSPMYEYFLVFNANSGPVEEKLLLVHRVESTEYAILGIVQKHERGLPRIPRGINEEPGTLLEAFYMRIRSGKSYDELNRIIEKEVFCELGKYHLLDYCSRSLNLFWDWIENNSYKGFTGMANPSPISSVQLRNINCIYGNVYLPTQPKKYVETVFLPCTLTHEEGTTTQFHLTPSGGFFLAKNMGDGRNYILHGLIFMSFS